MKKQILFLAFLGLMTMSGAVWEQSAYIYGLGFDIQTIVVNGKAADCALVNQVQSHLPAQRAGLKPGDVITAIDGQAPTSESLAQLSSKAKVRLSIKRFGNENLHLDISGLPCLSQSRAPESSYAWQDVAGRVDYYATVKTLNIEPIIIMSDTDTDYFQYKSFDFEFTGASVMQQREIAPVLEKLLTVRGLARDREHPDILVFMEFYSDRREQYVPPTEAVSTRYGEVITGIWGGVRTQTQQYIESETRGDYTRVDYLSKLSISMADARRLAGGEADKAQIWQADYEVVYSKRAEHKKFAEYIGFEMLAAFPFKTERIRDYSFYYTGIIYDAAVAGRVSGVVAGSPADQAGIKAGDVIKGCSWRSTTAIFRNSFNKLYERVKNRETYYLNYEDFALTRTSNSMYENNISSSFMYTYMSRYSIGSISRGLREISHASDDPLVFTVKTANGKTQKIPVRPIIAQEWVLFY